MPAPPPPLHVLRNHSSQLSALSFSTDNERLYSGDVQGTVLMTSTRTFRPVAMWQAHSDSILGIEEWLDVVITCVEVVHRRPTLMARSHGRDNKLHLWVRPEPAAFVGSAGATSAPVMPELRRSFDVNALNFCRFSLSAVSGASDALIALPNLVESSVVSRFIVLAWPYCALIQPGRRMSGLFQREIAFTPRSVSFASPVITP